jgi:hypothetical protein
VCDNQKQAVITNVYVTFLEGVEFVLLHGGSKRAFRADHYKVFREDLLDVQEFFKIGLPDKIVTVGFE